MGEPLAEIPFLRALGARLVRAQDGCAEIALELAPEHQNSLGMAHGGVVMTLLDVAMARAGRTVVDREETQPMVAVTVEMKTSFLRPAVGRLLARGRVLHRSATMAYCEAELFDGKDHLVAKSLGTFKFLRRK
ncbi:MAG TPA: PaaI family thioesterase [Burkholderiaceae bacterium]|jgi:uncharacterized protein (TIGR00369 family)|nr:PaaI family thioesterase [Burkholderiaceae bacterium]